MAATCGHAKAIGWLAMREGRLEALGVATSRLKPGQQWMWFHCASVGEYEQARPVMEAWRSLHPGDAFLLSFYSASGWDAFARRQPEWWTAADHVTAMPLDVRASMRSFVQAAGGAERLRGLLFAKYDVWPTLVAELIRARVPVGLFAGHVLPGRWPFRWGGGYQRQAWKAMRRVWVQTEASLPTLSAYGVNAEVAGDPRFDRVLDAVGQHQPDQALQMWVNDRPCFVVGSAWQPEWDAAREAWQEGQCAIVVPHEWTAESIAAEASRWEVMGARPVVWSAHRSADARAALPEGDVLIVDAMGELLDAYAVADVAVVGGGFGAGVHNTLEPAVFGIPVLIGPRYAGFREAEALVEAGGILPVAGPLEFEETAGKLLDNASYRRQIGAINRDYIDKNAGASIQILAGIRKLIG